jgi:hypothetical protein
MCVGSRSFNDIGAAALADQAQAAEIDADCCAWQLIQSASRAAHPHHRDLKLEVTAVLQLVRYALYYAPCRLIIYSK